MGGTRRGGGGMRLGDGGRGEAGVWGEGGKEERG